MNFIKKVEDKLASQPYTEILRQKVDADLGELALNCVKNASIAETIQNLLSTQGGQSVAAGLGGAALGGIGTALTSSQGADESEQDFKKRRIGDSAMGALAGGAAGAAAPVAASYFKTLNEGLSTPEKSVGEKILSMLSNPQTLATGAGAIGAQAGVNYANDRNIKFLSELTGKVKGPGTEGVAKALSERLAAATQNKLNPGLVRRLGVPAAGAAVGLGLFKGIANQPAFNDPVFEQ